ncbi:hypothetical protein ACFQV8_14070 [Pseudonocardia benzenivorans]
MSITATASPRLFAGKRGLMLASILFLNFVVWLDSAKFSLLNPFWSVDLHLTTAQISSVTASYLLGYFPAAARRDHGRPHRRQADARHLHRRCDRAVGDDGLRPHLRGDVVAELPVRHLLRFLWAPSQRLLSVWFPGALNARATSTWMSSCLVAG